MNLDWPLACHFGPSVDCKTLCFVWPPHISNILADAAHAISMFDTCRLLSLEAVGICCMTCFIAPDAYLFAAASVEIGRAHV